jgi:hypothetical protein
VAKYRPWTFQVSNGIDILQMYFRVYVGMNDFSYLFNNMSSGNTESHCLRYCLLTLFLPVQNAVQRCCTPAFDNMWGSQPMWTTS